MNKRLDEIAAHKCRESQTCSCYLLATEPNENCPVHGAGEWPPRCEECGRYLKREHESEALAKVAALCEIEKLERGGA